MRKTIYFKDDGSYEAIKGSAEKDGISVSKYIIRKCLGSGVVSKTVVKESGQLDRIEQKLDRLLVHPYSKKKISSVPPSEDFGSSAIASKSHKDAQKGLNKVYSDTVDNLAESKKVIRTVDDIPSTFRPYTKEHQSRKKSKGGGK